MKSRVAEQRWSPCPSREQEVVWGTRGRDSQGTVPQMPGTSTESRDEKSKHCSLTLEPLEDQSHILSRTRTKPAGRGPHQKPKVIQTARDEARDCHPGGSL